MKVKEFITELLNYNMDAELNVIVNHTQEDFSLTYGGSDGITKKNCENVSLYVDRYCSSEKQSESLIKK